MADRSSKGKGRLECRRECRIRLHVALCRYLRHRAKNAQSPRQAVQQAPESIFDIVFADPRWIIGRQDATALQNLQIAGENLHGGNVKNTAPSALPQSCNALR